MPAAKDHARSPARVVSQAEPRSEVLVVGIDNRRPDLSKCRKQLLAGVEIKTINVVPLLLDRRRRAHEFPSKSVVQREFAGDLPVVLEEQVMRLELEVRSRCADGSAHVRRIAEQEIRNTIARAGNGLPVAGFSSAV